MSQRWECRICWHVYDPEEGDDVWQIEAGTGFEELPEDWTCPICEATKDKFIRLGEPDA
ncbi:rubredoxin [Acidocella aromatica]|uniref:Rubredoxin n=1 Tax=Acidocella aromatica TaxID=1303579 RepID=A0A840VCW3_9PROT|nr:rubredoxin [Acidocella aromatica]MBB5373546.1 rubredoxin [Acidocella aromatica]